MGRVKRVLGDAVLVECFSAHGIAPLKPGDGVVFDAADWRSPEEAEEGGRVYGVDDRRDGTVAVRFASGGIDMRRIRAGDLLWRTHDPDVEKAARPFTEASARMRKQPVTVRVIARVGEALESVWTAGGVRVTVHSAAPLEAAANRGATIESFSQQFARLGNTTYELAGLDAEIAGEPFVAVSVLNQVRRQAVEALKERQRAVAAVDVADPGAVLNAALARVSRSGDAPGPAELHLLVRTPAQLDAAIAFSPSTITLDYLDLYGLQPSLDRVRASGIAVRVASPRVLKPGEESIAAFLKKLGHPVLVRSTGLLEAWQEDSLEGLIGDFSLNAANAITAYALLEMGLARVTPTHDLNAAQVADLARSVGAGKLEVVAYQHLPVFHTEHCVFCRFLSKGTSYKDCGRPCEEHRVALRDAAGRTHPVLADVGCRNTVFGAEAQQAAAHLADWLAAGIRHFRLEFAHETAEQTRRVSEAFSLALEGSISGEELDRRLKRIVPQGVTEGSLFVPAEYLTLPVL
jgi:putative protease